MKRACVSNGRITILLATTVLLALSPLATAETVRLVKDINPSPWGSTPTHYVNVNGTLYFFVNDQYNGVQLWTSDGTNAGTVLVKQINSGYINDSGIQTAFIGSILFFSADDGVHGFELWQSDGTAAGTVLVKDINAGANPSNPSNLTAVGSTLFFSADDGIHGIELWESDGTDAGTVLVKDINAGANPSFPSYLTAVGSTLFFLADDGIDGQELWKSDGTQAGTVMVKDINSGPNSSFPHYMTAVGSTLFFSADDGVHGQELWKSDGTSAGTVLVKDIDVGTNPSLPSNLTAAGSTLFFLANDGIHGNELWKSDGTGAGTVLVKDIWPGGNTSFISYPLAITAVGSTVFFSANDGVDGDELWKSDGTAAGTVAVKAINGVTGFPNILSLTAVGSTLFFFADDGIHGEELWKSDGTTAGTILVDDIKSGSVGSFTFLLNLTGIGSTFFFPADDGIHGVGLWKSDGTIAGTVLVKTITSINAGGAPSNPQELTVAGSTLFFTADDGIHGRELWKSDGTQAGTVMITGTSPGLNVTIADRSGGLTAVGSTLFFRADDGIHGYELWKSDGTAAGTGMVKDITPGPNDSFPPHIVLLSTAVGSTLFFSVYDETQNAGSLWKSDGTDAGTVKLSNYPTNSGGVAVMGSTYFFDGNDGIHGTELWKSDGTVAGTVMVKDIAPGNDPIYNLPNASTPAYFAVMGSTLFFTADDGSHTAELWKSDGTAAGTVLVKAIDPHSAGSNSVDNLVVVGSTIFFGADDGIHGPELWKSDGTATGTVLVKDINPGANGSFPYGFVVVGSIFYFTADDGIHGDELWKSDGTAAGTVLVNDINPGVNSSYVEEFGVIGSTIYFNAIDGVHGDELWKSDGTAAGTVLVQDINSGPNSSDPLEFAVIGSTLFFPANDGIHGTELWAADAGNSGVNQPPIVNAGPNQTVTLPSTASLNGVITDDGLPNPPGAVSATWSVVSGPGTVTFGNASATITTAAFSTAGTYVLRLTGNDSALSTTSDVTITVNPVPPINQPPVVNAGPDQTITLPSTASLNGVITDDGLPNPPGAVSATWSVVSGPGTVTFGNVSATITTATFSTAGTYILRLTGNDSALSTTSDVTLTVNDVPPPVITSATTATGTSGASFSYQIAATNNPISYSATGLPAGLSIDTTTGIISGTPPSLGDTTVTIGATNHGGTGTAALLISIAIDPNSGPSLTSITASPNPADISAQVTFSAFATDPNPASLIFSWDFGDGNTAIGPTVSHAYTSEGSYKVQVAVVDGAGKTDSGTVIEVVDSAGSGGGGSGSFSMIINTLTASFTPIGGHDTVSMSGMLPILSPFDATGSLVLNLNGFSATFNLEKGKAKSGGASFAFILKPAKRLKTNLNPIYPAGNTPFTVKFTRETIGKLWGLDFTKSQSNAQMSLSLVITYLGDTFTTSVTVSDTQKANKSAKIVNKK